MGRALCMLRSTTLNGDAIGLRQNGQRIAAL
jgi:hypothetical protein